MSWTCPNCNFVVEGDSVRCAACNYQLEMRLVLSSNVGNNWRTFITADVTRRTYKRLYPDVEHQYVPRNEGEHPYSVEKNVNNEWMLKPNGQSPVGVAINGTPCEDGYEYPLNEGDVISIASQSDNSRQVAPLKVSFSRFENP